MAGPTVGLDIGSNLMKVVEARSSGGGVQVVALGVAPTPPEAIENSVIVDPQLLGQKVKEMMKQAGVTARRVVSSVSGQAVVVRVIDMPRAKPAELAEQMKWEVERHVPFQVSEVIMDYQAIERPNEPEGPNMEVLLAVAQQDMVDRHVDMLRAAGLKPVVIDVEPLAASRCLLDLAPAQEPNHTVVILNIGASNTDIGIYRDKLLAFPRTLPVAGANLTHAIANALQVDLLTAENYKREYGEVMMDQMQQPSFEGGNDFGGAGGFHDFTMPAAPAPDPAPIQRMPFDFTTPDEAPPMPPSGPYATSPPDGPPSGPFDAPGAVPDQGFMMPGSAPAPAPAGGNLPVLAGPDPNESLRIEIFNAMAPTLTELAQELRRSLDYYRGRATDAVIHEVLLIGGTAKLNGLASFLERELGIPTRVADPLHTVTVTSKNYSESHLQEIASLFPVSIGLAARDMVPAPAGSKKR